MQSPEENMTKILCAFCGTPYTKDMLNVYNGNYGCESGCEYVTYVVVCETCKREVYIKGEFGSYEEDDEKKELLKEIDEDEIIKAVKEGHEYHE